MALLPVVSNREKREMMQYEHRASRFLFVPDLGVSNFAVTGVGRRQAVVTELLRTVYGRIPVVVIHGCDETMRAVCGYSWQYAFDHEAVSTNGRKFWDCQSGQFEPFYGMDAETAWECLKELAPENALTNVYFESVIEGYLDLARILKNTISLTTFQYLCSFETVAKLEAGIKTLPCSEHEKESLRAKLALDEDDGKTARLLFRNLIRDLAVQAKKSGWNPQNASQKKTGRMSITAALQQGAAILIPVNTADNIGVLMRYLCAELRKNSTRPFLLILDNVSTQGSGIEALLEQTQIKFRYGLISPNLVEMVGGEENFYKVATRLQRIITFSVPTAPLAQTLSSLLGEDYVTRQTITNSTDRGWLEIFPNRKGHSTAVHTEKASRLDVQELLSLKDDRVVIMDLISGNYGRL